MNKNQHRFGGGWVYDSSVSDRINKRRKEIHDAKTHLRKIQSEGVRTIKQISTEIFYENMIKSLVAEDDKERNENSGDSNNNDLQRAIQRSFGHPGFEENDIGAARGPVNNNRNTVTRHGHALQSRDDRPLQFKRGEVGEFSEEDLAFAVGLSLEILHLGHEDMGAARGSVNNNRNTATHNGHARVHPVYDNPFQSEREDDEQVKRETDEMRAHEAAKVVRRNNAELRALESARLLHKSDERRLAAVRQYKEQIRKDRADEEEKAANKRGYR